MQKYDKRRFCSFEARNDKTRVNCVFYVSVEPCSKIKNSVRLITLTKEKRCLQSSPPLAAKEDCKYKMEYLFVNNYSQILIGPYIGPNTYW